MKFENLDFTQAHFSSPLLRDYLAQNERLSPFYSVFPSFENLYKQAGQKAFSAESRALLVRTLRAQYQGFTISESVSANLSSLGAKHTFTLTTGQQLNLFSGPVYTWYKIQTVINLCQALNHRYRAYHFVPVYWMATEDHDCKEIDHFNFNGHLIRWPVAPAGAVGRLPTDSIAPFLPDIERRFGTSDRGKQLMHWFVHAYQNHKNLADATRYLINEWFGDQGLLILDGDSKPLKESFIPYLKAELFDRVAHREVGQSAQMLAELGYSVQAKPRPINLFYLRDNLRARLVQQGESFGVLHLGRSFSKREMMREVEAHPERFSPNVITRPLYQEAILPNLAYIGGSAELAYGLQLKRFFDSQGVLFPILIRRNSLLILSEKQREKLSKLGLSPEVFNLPLSEIITVQTRKNSNLDLQFTREKKQLAQLFVQLKKRAEQTDRSFIGAVQAQEAKQLKGMKKLEKRLLQAEKTRMRLAHARIESLKNTLCPAGKPQERVLNFSGFYLDYGNAFAQAIQHAIRPLENEFLYLTL
ncbi:MAG: bacillithiol biosynthesis cysteine-adding enzyme BshC [Flavobacteriales bacterium]